MSAQFVAVAEIVLMFAGVVALGIWLWYDYRSAKCGNCSKKRKRRLPLNDEGVKFNLMLEPNPALPSRDASDPNPQTPDENGTAPSDLETPVARCRLRDLGVTPGVIPTGPHNAITDAGVLVGHTTLNHGDGPILPGHGPVRTGVTVIIPHKGDLWTQRPSAGYFVLNGNGCVTALDWMKEAGLIEGPIGLTNTHSVGDVYKGIITWMQDKYPEIGTTGDTTMPVVAECDDSALSDVRGFHVKVEHVVHALDHARGGYVAEGAVGAGTGMTSFQFKGGIGTSSRVVEIGGQQYTVGVLVNCNHARRPQLSIMGVPVGQALEREQLSTKSTEGSIVIVVATDAPLSPRQLERIAKRAAMGLALTGATANTSSGDFIIAFSNGRMIPRESESVLTLPELSDGGINPLFQATVEATAESVWNALCKAETVIGRDGNISPALPLDRVRALLASRGLVKA